MANRMRSKGEDIGERYPSRIIDWHGALGIDSAIALGNPSFCGLDDGNRLVSIRQFNYVLNFGRDKHYDFKQGFFKGRANYFVITDKEFNFIRKVECKFEKLWGCEDLRLLRFGDMFQASGTDESFGPNKHRPGCWNFRFINGQEVLGLESYRIFDIRMDKNYIPVEGRKERFISNLRGGAFDLISSQGGRKERQPCKGLVSYRGSTQLLSYNGGYVAIVHHRRGDNFRHAFAFFSHDLSSCRISDEFLVFGNKDPTCFTCGMSIEGGKAVVLFCLNDQITYLFHLPIEEFEKTAKPRGNA